MKINGQVSVLLCQQKEGKGSWGEGWMKRNKEKIQGVDS